MNKVNEDLQHLKILAVMYYVMTGFLAVLGLLFTLYILMGAMLVATDLQPGVDEPAVGVAGGVVILFGLFFMAIFFIFAFGCFWAGRSLMRHRSYAYCLVVAGLTCLWFPLGTVLGVFTIVVLLRGSVKQLFLGEAASQSFGPPGYNTPRWQ